MKLLVGCPVTDRNWILPTWTSHVYDAVEAADEITDLGFIFVVSSEDTETLDCLDSIKGLEGSIVVSEPLRSYPGDHLWNKSRYEHMATLRNLLLAGVRAETPDLFLSLDSDILLSPKAIASALEGFEIHSDADGIGMKCFLSQRGSDFPNFGTWLSKWAPGRFVRRNLNSLIRVDVLMAAKLLKEPAYSVDYQSSHWGEDIGWALNAYEQRLRFFWDGRVTNKHVMRPEMLDEVDRRLGW